VKFVEQCQPFVLRLREGSNKAIEEREEVANELADLQTQLAELKAQRAEDEPRCDVLRSENAAITAHLMATKEMQMALVKDIETLKIEKAGVLQRKVHLNSFIIYSERILNFV
jgi:kinetochore protein Nuf2